MDIFKLKTGINPAYKITKVNFEEKTLKEEPYVQKQVNTVSYYAVCPKCDNPIQIVGLQKNTSESGRKPYGRHNKGDVIGLAPYSEIDYLECPFSNPSWVKKPGKRSPKSPLANRTLRAMRDYFDCVIKLLEERTGLRFSRNLAKQMLESYLLDEGWLYRQATLNNIPWILGESSPAIPLFGRYLYKDSALSQAIHTKCTDIALEPAAYSADLVQIRNKPGQFIRLEFIFCNHQQTIKGESMQETIDFWVFSKNNAGHVDTIFRKTIPIEANDLVNLIQESEHRNIQLLAIAKELTKNYI
ncbi:hypothetical protein [Latilactobacillus fragifolii]|uniref:hypothetical protein n=1 Tax=Latilactobacillus fragifolii TaxID=2814244 RepID=UPI001ABBB5EF|nr:hypothetical protein [Latilactobacillus fragifolii]